MSFREREREYVQLRERFNFEQFSNPTIYQSEQKIENFDEKSLFEQKYLLLNDIFKTHYNCDKKSKHIWEHNRTTLTPAHTLRMRTLVYKNIETK